MYHHSFIAWMEDNSLDLDLDTRSSETPILLFECVMQPTYM